MKISVIIICHNDEQYITEAIESALLQKYEPMEIIVVDDGSSDRSRSIIEGFRSRIDDLILQPNKGLSAARNAGIKVSTGEFIVVLDGDDYIDEMFCEKSIRLFDNSEGAKIVSCSAVLFNQTGRLGIYQPEGGDLKNFLFKNSAIGNSLFKKSDWFEAGGYDEEMRKGYEDWEFFIRILEHGGKAYILEEPLFYYRQKENSMRRSANKIKFELWKYIYYKHQGIYVEHYRDLIDFFLWRIQWEEKEKIKALESLEHKIGTKILAPLKWLKSI